MTRHFKLAALLAACVAVSLVPARAEAQVKIGVVDVQTAIFTTKDGKKAKEKLEKLAKKKEKEIDSKSEEIKKMEEEMKKQLPVMSDSGKQDMLQKYRTKGMELQQLYMDSQTYLQKKKSELFEPVLTKMNAIIQDMALSDGYTVILDSSMGAVVYYQPSTDVTAEVIKRYNKK